MSVGAWPRNPARRELVPTGTWLLVAGGVPLLGLLVLPLLALVWRTPPAALWAALGHPDTLMAISLSLRTSAIGVLVIVLSGTPLAYLLARRRPRVAPLLEVLVDLPTVLPPAVAGLALLMAFGRRGLLGPWLSAVGIQLPFTAAAVVMAQVFVAAPYYIKAAALGLSGVSYELEQAASLDGAQPWEVFRYITLPLAWQGIGGGVALCWARALGEFGATIIFAGNLPGRTQTMPLAVYIGFEIDLTNALTLAVILLAISSVILVAARAALRRYSQENGT
jgi:molybdate transport system permease protein